MARTTRQSGERLTAHYFYATELASVVPARLHYEDGSRIVVQKRGNHPDEQGGGINRQLAGGEGISAHVAEHFLIHASSIRKQYFPCPTHLSIQR